MVTRRELIEIQIEYLINAHLDSLRDKEKMLGIYMIDVKKLGFPEIIAYRDYLNNSITRYREAIEGYQRDMRYREF